MATSFKECNAILVGDLKRIIRQILFTVASRMEQSKQLHISKLNFE